LLENFYYSGVINIMPNLLAASACFLSDVTSIAFFVRTCAIKRELGYAASASTVAEFYRDFLEIFVLDIRDRGLKSVIESLGLKVSLHDTLMRTPEDEIRLAKEVLNATLNPSNP